MAWTAPRTWVVGDIVTAAMMNANVRDNLNALAPVGSYMHLHHGATRVESIINGAWLECNGAAISRTTYATLFAAIGGTHGAGDGSTTFNLPDLAGRVIVGYAGSGGHSDVTSLGNHEGAALGSRRPRHKHAVAQPTITITDPQHRHPYHSGTNGGSTYGPNAEGMTSTSFATAAFGTDAVSTGITAAASGGTVGPQTGAEPTDTPAYLVTGVWAIKF